MSKKIQGYLSEQILSFKQNANFQAQSTNSTGVLKISNLNEYSAVLQKSFFLLLLIIDSVICLKQKYHLQCLIDQLTVFFFTLWDTFSGFPQAKALNMQQNSAASQ